MFFAFSGNISAQHGMLTSKNDIIGEASEFFIGLHSGIFDANQTGRYPYNIGVVVKYNYIPNVTKRLFLGSELGVFYVTSDKDDLFRKLQATFLDMTFYPGYSIPLGTKIRVQDNASIRVKKFSQARKFKIGMGFTVIVPLKVSSTGATTNNSEAVKSGIGVSLRTSFDLPNRVSLFASVTRIGRDLDGFGVHPGSIEPHAGNLHDVSYYLKVGFSWNFLAN